MPSNTNAPGQSLKFTVVQDGRTRKVTTTTQEGEAFEGPDSINDAIYRLVKGTEPCNRRDDDETGGTA